MGDLLNSTSSIELEDALVDVQDRHVAAETAGQGGGGDDGFAHGAHLPASAFSMSLPIGVAVVFALADGDGEADLLPQDGPDRADVHGLAGLLLGRASRPASRSTSIFLRGPRLTAAEDAFGRPWPGRPRTQRWHWMQRLWSSMILGRPRRRPRGSGTGRGSGARSSGSGSPAPGARSCRSFRRSGTCGCPRRRASRRGPCACPRGRERRSRRPCPRRRAGCRRPVAAADPDRADAAAAGGLESLVVAERRDVDAVVLGRLDDGLARLGRRRPCRLW